MTLRTSASFYKHITDDQTIYHGLQKTS